MNGRTEAVAPVAPAAGLPDSATPGSAGLAVGVAAGSRYLVRPTPSFWRALRFLAGARLIVALVLVGYTPLMKDLWPRAASVELGGFSTLSRVYLGFAILAWIVTRLSRTGFHLRLLSQVVVDILLIGWLVHTGGAAVGGVGVLMLTPVATAAILTTPMLALFIASLGSIVLLGEAAMNLLFWPGTREAHDGALLQAALISALLLFAALVLNLLARRLASEESHAHRTMRELQQQMAINQLVIDEIDRGVLVFGADSMLRAINPKAREILRGIGAGAASTVDKLARQIRDGEAQATWQVERSDGGSLRLRSRLLGVHGHSGHGSLPATTKSASRIAAALSGADAVAAHESGGVSSAASTERVVLIEDMAEVDERALQLKLASMGRLSASIAHEIRNPLGAIRHAGGLLSERLEHPTERRLTAIIETNSLRIDRIVEDVLSVARRNAQRERISLALFVQNLLADEAHRHPEPGRVRALVDPHATMQFDPEHLRQILVNLLANARRHASHRSGAITIEGGQRIEVGQRIDGGQHIEVGQRIEVGQHIEAGQHTLAGSSALDAVLAGAATLRACAPARVLLRVGDDGPGVAPADRHNLFEPFFTTGARGTGLGLYMSRELCAANDAVLRYEPGTPARPGGAFVIEAGA